MVLPPAVAVVLAGFLDAMRPRWLLHQLERWCGHAMPLNLPRPPRRQIVLRHVPTSQALALALALVAD